MHYCSTENGSSSSPILNISNNKIIGIHKKVQKQGNIILELFYIILLKNIFLYITISNRKRFLTIKVK